MADPSFWNPKGSKDEQQRNKEIEKGLKEHKKQLEREVKLLLLGAGESGKTTISKQMKILFIKGFTEKEKQLFSKIIHSNVVQAMQDLIKGARALKIRLENEPAADQVLALQPTEELVVSGVPVPTYELSGDLIVTIKQLWRDAGVQQAFGRQNEFQLNDSVAYFMNDLDRIVASGYAPNDQDLLRARVRTTGVQELLFEIEGVPFRMIDVGGQRGERSKWIPHFQDVTAVIFCVALSEYDLKLREEESVNRMHESLQLFDEICNNRWFKDTPMILFLNKRDLFEEKIQKIDLNVCFPEYQDGCDFDKASKFIKKKFVSKNQSPQQKDIYAHITVATDTNNVRVVFNAVKDIILNRTMKGYE